MRIQATLIELRTVGGRGGSEGVLNNDRKTERQEFERTRESLREEAVVGYDQDTV